MIASSVGKPAVIYPVAVVKVQEAKSEMLEAGAGSSYDSEVFLDHLQICKFALNRQRGVRQMEIMHGAFTKQVEIF